MIIPQLKLPPILQVALAAFVMWLAHNNAPISHFQLSFQKPLALALVALGTLLCLVAGKLFINARTTVDPRDPRKSSALVTSGIYRISRNPMYVGFFCALTGYAVALGSLSPFLVLPLFGWFMNHSQIIPEERILATRFGEHYQDYKQRVRRWL